MKYIDRVGEKYTTNEGYEVEIVERISARNIVIVFNTKEKHTVTTAYGLVKRGEIKNPYHPSVHGVGYMGVGKYVSKINNQYTLEYRTWQSMIRRCYDEAYLKRESSYKECIVEKEWHNFQNFGAWFEENFNPEIMKGWHLDKDVLAKKGIKVYSSETCCFIPVEINCLLVNPSKMSRTLPTGVHRNRSKFRASLVYKHLGVFDTIKEASDAYKTAKEIRIKEVADEWKGLISEKVYISLSNHKFDTTLRKSFQDV